MNALKKLFKRDLVNIENLVKVLHRNIASFFYAPIVFAVKVIMHSKVFIRSKTSVNPQLLDLFCNSSITAGRNRRLIHSYKLSSHKKINYGIYAAFENFTTFECLT